MSLLSDFLAPRKRLLRQAREIRQLKKELDALQARNASMSEGMRRCINCEYRIDFKNRQGQAPVKISNP